MNIQRVIHELRLNRDLPVFGFFQVILLFYPLLVITMYQLGCLEAMKLQKVLDLLQHFNICCLVGSDIKVSNKGVQCAMKVRVERWWSPFLLTIEIVWKKLEKKQRVKGYYTFLYNVPPNYYALIGTNFLIICPK